MSSGKTDPTIPTNIVGVRRDRAVRPHHLDQVRGPGAPRRITLDRAEMVVGRATDADICVPSPKVSRLHALLTRQGGDYSIRDNDSRNGIFLNGLKVYSAVLRDGDILQVADNIYVYHEG